MPRLYSPKLLDIARPIQLYITINFHTTELIQPYPEPYIFLIATQYTIYNQTLTWFTFQKITLKYIVIKTLTKSYRTIHNQMFKLFYIVQHRIAYRLLTKRNVKRTGHQPSSLFLEAWKSKGGTSQRTSWGFSQQLFPV